MKRILTALACSCAFAMACNAQSMLGARMAVWQKRGGLPSPYRQASLVYSDGTAFCIIPHIHTDAKNARIECEIETLPNFNFADDMKFKNLFGDSTSDNNWLINNYNTYNGTVSSPNFELYCGSSLIAVKRAEYKDYEVLASRRYSIVGYREGSYSHLTITTDGKVFSPNPVYQSKNMTLGRLGIFTQNNAGAGNGVNPIANRVPKKVGFRNFKYWDGNTQIADLIPVVDTNTNEACFYNLIDGSVLKKYSTGTLGYIL